jgi:CRP-like cAMP-binding protein
MRKTAKPLRPGRSVSSERLAKPAANVEIKHPAHGNYILGALPSKEFDRLTPKLKPVKLELNETLYRPEERVEHVYFLTSGIVSLLTVLEDGTSIEIALLGSDGMVGVSAMMGVPQTTTEALVQHAGEAFKMPVSDLLAEFNKGGVLRDFLLRYTYSLFAMISQNAACNQLHTVEKRLARWLLLTHDRVDGDQFVFTQDFMSRMLGVRRAGVSVAANTLRQRGLINYSRGKITILDRASLEDAACECYRAVKAATDGFLR